MQHKDDVWGVIFQSTELQTKSKLTTLLVKTDERIPILRPRLQHSQS